MAGLRAGHPSNHPRSCPSWMAGSSPAMTGRDKRQARDRRARQAGGERSERVVLNADKINNALFCTSAVRSTQRSRINRSGNDLYVVSLAKEFYQLKKCIQILFNRT